MIPFTTTFVSASVAMLLIIFILTYHVKKDGKKNISILTVIAFALVIVGIILGVNANLSFGFMWLGLLAAVFDVFVKPQIIDKAGKKTVKKTVPSVKAARKAPRVRTKKLPSRKSVVRARKKAKKPVEEAEPAPQE